MPLPPPPADRRLQEFHEAWQRNMVQAGKISDADLAPIKRLLTQMFPRLDEVLNSQQRRNPVLDGPCVYRKLKPGRSDGEARRGSGVNE
jgi:hypothetical protein